MRAKELGYSVFLLFYWLPSPEMVIERVAIRVASGGHDISKDVIYRRYWLGLQILFDIFVPIVDEWSLYNNGGDLEIEAKFEVKVRICQKK